MPQAAIAQSAELRNFRRIADDLLFAPALSDLSRRPELWDVFTARQGFKNSPHRDTQTIPLRGPPTITENILDNMEAENYKIFPKLMNIASLVLELAGIVNAREIGRVMLVKLRPGGNILPHSDQGMYARYYARFHFPLTSNSKVLFRSGEEVVNMKPGELWWFNHQVEHEVNNSGSTDRIHVIFDCCAPGYTGALA